MEEIPIGIISCRHINWIFDLCADHHIDPQRILKHVRWSRAQLQRPDTFIDWDSFLTLFSNLGNYFTDEQLIEAGTDAWRHRHLQTWSVVGRMLYGIKEQYLSLFDTGGVISTIYPVETAARDVAPGHLEITLRMQGHLVPCRVFQVLLAGHLAGLPTCHGEQPAIVHINHTATGATYDVWFEPGRSMLGALQRLLSWPATARQAAQELAESQQALSLRDRKIQGDAVRLKTIEHRARESQARYRLLENNVKDVLLTLDPSLRLQYISASVEALTGYTKSEVMRMDLRQLLAPESLQQLNGLLQRQREGDVEHEDAKLEIEIHHKNGRNLWAEIRTSFMADAEGKVALLFGVIRDITERKYFEADLNEQEESYRAITTNAQDAIVTVDERGIITLANPAAARIFGYEESDIEGRALVELIPDAGLGAIPPDPATDFATDTLQLEGKRSDGGVLSLEASFAEHLLRAKRYTTWIIRDVSARVRSEKERQTLEHQLQAIQRMDSIGELTGGIAHDFNNLLVAINGYAELAMQDGLPPEKARQYVNEIRAAGARAADMTQKLLAFSRRQIIEPSLVDVNQLIRGIEKMIVRLLPENIEVKFLQGLTNPTILADAGQIEQVLVNLAVNARDAMPDGGRLQISVDHRTSDGFSLARQQGDLPVEYAVIRVEDTGTGMEEATSKRIFEPFFTTKPEGAGTGLGMSVVFGIVKQHNGHIDVQSTPGKGTRFDIFLPISQERLPARKKNKRLTRPTTANGNETILLVEDNEQVRDLATLMLSGAGYNVLEARDGREALDLFSRQATRFDLVIMDVVMPRMGGREVMESLRRINPAIRILFTSGYSSSDSHTNFITEEGLDFIQKPYDANSLLNRVRFVLDQGSAADDPWQTDDSRGRG